MKRPTAVHGDDASVHRRARPRAHRDAAIGAVVRAGGRRGGKQAENNQARGAHLPPYAAFANSGSASTRGNVASGAGVRIVTPVRVRDKPGLRDMMAPYLAWGESHDVPLFLGEFGVYKACFANGKGGLGWVADAYDLAVGDGVSGNPRVAGLSYHQYHEDAFALYYGSGPVDPANANQPLIDLLTSKLRAPP